MVLNSEIERRYCGKLADAYILCEYNLRSADCSLASSDLVRRKFAYAREARCRHCCMGGFTLAL